MNRTEFHNLLVDGKIEEILDNLSEVFAGIDGIASELAYLELSDEQYKDYLTQLTGIYIYLSPLVAEAISVKKNAELREYHSIKMECENEGKKFVSAPAEKEASMKVADLRRIRNILQAYLDACKVGISSCQSIIKYRLDEKRYLPEE